jgi:hypothetical protein
MSAPDPSVSVTAPAPRESIAARSARPSLYDIIFIFWAIAIPLGFSNRLLSSDGDLARHLRLGEVMLEQHAVLRQEFFSHTAAGRPFLAFEWLSEVVYAGAERIGGLALVAIVASLLLALTFTLVARFLIKRGADPLLAYLVSMAAAVLTGSHWLARPHLFTLLAVVILLDLLERTEPPRVWVFAVLFVVWANLHGGFVYGLILIGAYLVGDLLEARSADDPALWKRRARARGTAFGVALLATLVNPYGIKLLMHVSGFFGNDAIIRQTNEFQSPDFHTINAKIFLLALLGVMAGLALVQRRPRWHWLLIVLGNTAMALVSQRNIELFGIAALPLVALHLDPEWRRLPVFGKARGVFQREYRGSYPGVGASIITVLLLCLALVNGRVAGVQLVEDRFDPTTFPADVTARARKAGLSGPLFNEFIWGGWLLHEWPEQRVFIDGGTDFYGEALFKEYVQVWNLDPGWRDVLSKWKIRWALIGPRSRLATQLVREPGWTIWDCDSVAVMLNRNPPADSVDPSALERLKRCVGQSNAKQ